MKNRGQLAIGLAFAFTAVLAMFGLLFNSAMLTREKMKLQQTSDFAALVASDVQRHNLNFIRTLNEIIEIDWLTTWGLIQPLVPPIPFCQQLMGDIGDNANTVVGSIATFLNKTYTNPIDCVSACNDYDQWWRDFYTDIYKTQRAILASFIETSIGGANEKATKRAMETFLTPRNLPFQLKKLVSKWFNGPNPSVADVLARYQADKLDGHLNLESTEKMTGVPLFVRAYEPKTFTYRVYTYLQQWRSPPTTDPYCAPPIWRGIGTTQADAKVIKSGDLTSFFLASANYLPPNTAVDKKFALYLKETDPTRRENEPFVRYMGSGKVAPLFHINDKSAGLTKTSLVSMALAKPYGGTYPKAGNMLLPVFLPDEKGAEFKGSRLSGIADRPQLGFNLGLGGELAPGVPVFQEDFLH